MQGTVVSVDVAAGDTVRAGQPVVILESMKMEHVVVAECDGVVVGIAVAVGDTVALVITADRADEVHVHGYDLTADLSPGEPATITFEATVPGVWEVELHDAGLPLAELEVS